MVVEECVRLSRESLGLDDRLLVSLKVAHHMFITATEVREEDDPLCVSVRSKQRDQGRQVNVRLIFQRIGQCEAIFGDVSVKGHRTMI